MRNGDPEPAVTPDGSSASQPDVSDGDASGQRQGETQEAQESRGLQEPCFGCCGCCGWRGPPEARLLTERRRRARAGGQAPTLLRPLRSPDRSRRGPRRDSRQAVPQPRLLPLGGPPARGSRERRMTVVPTAAAPARAAAQERNDDRARGLLKRVVRAGAGVRLAGADLEVLGITRLDQQDREQIAELAPEIIALLLPEDAGRSSRILRDLGVRPVLVDDPERAASIARTWPAWSASTSKRPLPKCGRRSR